MLRSLFFSTGFFVMLWGVTFLFVDKIHLKVQNETLRRQGFRGLFTMPNIRQPKVFDPPDWAAFSLMSVGAVTMLYSLALRKKQTAE